VFQMEVVEALAEHSGLVVFLDADTLPRVKPAEALLQMFDDVLVHESTSAIAEWPDNHGLSCRRPASVRKPSSRRSSRPAITHARPSPSEVHTIHNRWLAETIVRCYLQQICSRFSRDD